MGYGVCMYLRFIYTEERKKERKEVGIHYTRKSVAGPDERYYLSLSLIRFLDVSDP